MPTRSGWAVAATGVAALVGGRVFGLLELWIVGAALLALVAYAVGWVLTTPLRLEMARSVRPKRVHAGDAGQVVLTIRNEGRRPTPVLSLHDELQGTAGASMLVAPIERGARSSAAYALPTERRGHLLVGPLRVELGDAFGLARTTATAVGRSTITVFPRVVDLAPPPRRGGADPHGRRARGLHHEGEDFHSLRPYVIGDDLRRVHWPATAHRDELVVRQLDQHRQGRTTVVLETRTDRHVGDSFETAVSSAASVLSAAHRRGDELRLLSTGGHDTGVDDGEDHLLALLGWLATAEANTGVVVTSAPPDGGATPVRITTDLDPTVGPGTSRNGGLTVIVATGPEPTRPVALGPGTVLIDRPEDLVGARPRAPVSSGRP